METYNIFFKFTANAPGAGKAFAQEVKDACVLDKGTDWTKTEIDGKTGYISTWFLKF